MSEPKKFSYSNEKDILVTANDLSEEAHEILASLYRGKGCSSSSPGARELLEVGFVELDQTSNAIEFTEPGKKAAEMVVI